jgi:hypothetical protein
MASSAYDTLYRWARRTTSSFADLCLSHSSQEQDTTQGDGLVYRLREWPQLPDADRTANVYRALSLMSTRPVNRGWFLRHSRMKARELDRLLGRLVSQGAVEVVDVSGYAATQARATARPQAMA